MTYFQDLSPLTYFDSSPGVGALSTHLVAVGWLDPDYRFSRSEIPPPSDVMDKLWAVSSKFWNSLPLSFLGYHHCGFCPNARPKTPTPVTYKGETRDTGAANIFVPGEGKIFVAPSLVLHYTLEHQYRLPDEFCSALLASPLPDTREYDRAMRHNGPSAFRYLHPLPKRWWQIWK